MSPQFNKLFKTKFQLNSRYLNSFTVSVHKYLIPHKMYVMLLKCILYKLLKDITIGSVTEKEPLGRSQETK